jgi:hypothetical protein
MRGVLCNAQGLVIGEMVYRCIKCSEVTSSHESARSHYFQNHVDPDDEDAGHMSSDPDEQDQRLQSAVIDSNIKSDQTSSASSSLTESHPTLVRSKYFVCPIYVQIL